MSEEKRKRGLYYYKDDYGQWQKVYKIGNKCWTSSVDKNKLFATAKECFKYLNVPY